MENGADTLQTILTVSSKIKIHPPYDPAIANLGIYPRKMKIYVHIKTGCKYS